MERGGGGSERAERMRNSENESEKERERERRTGERAREKEREKERERGGRTKVASLKSWSMSPCICARGTSLMRNSALLETYSRSQKRKGGCIARARLFN